MVKPIRKLFNLYPGEGRRTFLFALTGFLWSSGIYGCLTLSEGLFLEKVGADKLPTLYLILPLGLCFFATILLFALSRLAAHRLLLTVMSIAIGVYSTLFFLLKTTAIGESPSFWFFFRCCGTLFDISTYICYWSLIDHFFDLQHAKRLFCLFTGVLFLGDAVGGALISWALTPLGIPGLIGIFILMTAAAIPLVAWITKNVTPLLEEHLEDLNTSQEESLPRFLSSVLRSRFTLILMFAYFVMNIVAIVTEFTSYDLIERTFKDYGREHQVAEFLGFLCAVISIANMIFGLFFYSRLTKKMGIGNIILIAPGYFVCVALLWLTGDFLYIAVMGVVAHEGITYCFEDNNLNLLVAGVPPRIKNQTRASIEMFLEPAGMLVSGLLLIIFQQESKLLGLSLSAIALSAMFLLRSEYAKAIMRNLIDQSIRFEKRANDWLGTFSKKEKKEIEYLLLSTIKTADEPSKLLAYESLLKIGDHRFLSRLIHQMSLLSIPGKLKVIELLIESPFARENSVLDLLNRWRKTIPHPAIIGAIHFYFARHKLVSPYHIADDLGSNHLTRKAAAILSFKTFGQKKEECDLHDLALRKHLTLLTSTDENEICMGLKILSHEAKKENLPELFPFIHHHSIKVKRLASFAIAQSASKESASLAPTVIEFLPSVSDNATRLYLLEAIEKMDSLDCFETLLLSTIHFRPNERKKVERIACKMAHPLKAILSKMMKDVNIHHRPRLLAGKILGTLHFTHFRKEVDSIVCDEIERAYFYYYHAHTIQSQIPELELQILENALLSGYNTVLDFIIQLIGVGGGIEESEVLIHSIRSKNQKLRAQAFETIEKAASRRIFALLEPLIDHRELEQKLQLYLSQGRSPMTLWQLLDAMEESASTSDQLISISLKMRFASPGWKKSLERKIASKEKIFHHFANEVVKS